MAIRVNFADTELRDFDALPAGWYDVAITKIEEKASGPNAKNPGSPYLNFEFTIIDGEYEKRKFWSVASLLPQALFTLKEILVALGEDANSEVDIDTDDLVGRELQVKVNRRPDANSEGDFKNEIKKYALVGTNPTVTGAESSSLLP